MLALALIDCQSHPYVEKKKINEKAKLNEINTERDRKKKEE